MVVGHKMKVETEQNLNKVILKELFMNGNISEIKTFSYIGLCVNHLVLVPRGVVKIPFLYIYKSCQ